MFVASYTFGQEPNQEQKNDISLIIQKNTNDLSKHIEVRFFDGDLIEIKSTKNIEYISVFNSNQNIFIKYGVNDTVKYIPVKSLNKGRNIFELKERKYYIMFSIIKNN
ncbi:hypothetical protein HYO65_gp221 [Tenacibaculum phage PTm1]|uniref:Uncharacterized protein n=2 Tax=Shirahamavirus PTm1 TaxID=2846435 RepID=A0A5S9EQP4_9CAUD|nr:hypothetical protein HYO65_gp221 [Tenacibaculum phage PTm1]BBI90613.1 hypothetical protein [Tenacibaculum phage PTm1]BBI90919.1 hypothetical protein [Tenacibaculum phage PTm5]